MYNVIVEIINAPFSLIAESHEIFSMEHRLTQIGLGLHLVSEN